MLNLFRAFALSLAISALALAPFYEMVRASTIALTGAGAQTTASFASWNPSDKNASITLSNANATFAAPSAVSVRSLQSQTTGKWVAGITFDSGSANFAVGVANASATLANYPGFDANGWAYFGAGQKVHAGSNLPYGVSVVAGDQVDVILDATNGKLYFAKNGTVMNSGDPVAGTGFAYSGLSGTLFLIGGTVGAATQGTLVAPMWTGSGFSRW